MAKVSGFDGYESLDKGVIVAKDEKALEAYKRRRNQNNRIAKLEKLIAELEKRIDKLECQ
jgi:peptidoglycan hydrolase CwlO-like protein